MLKKVLSFILFSVFINSFSQNTPNNARVIEDERGRNITNEDEKRIFLAKLKQNRDLESKQLSTAKINQTAVELCTNSGFEQYETINGSQKLKNFLYTIGDPPGPTQCRSITNTANSNIDIYNPNNMSVMATTVPANLIDPYLGNIKAFDQYALKINYENSSTYGSIVQSKRFKTNNEDYLKFNFKSVLMTVYDSGHTDNQPFVKARIINSTGTVVSEFCLVGDETNCIFTKIPNPDAAILYTSNWQSGLLDISSIPNNEEFTVEFMASRCGLGGHFGYMYVDDICLLHSSENLQGSIELNPLNKVCSNLPINVCGSYTIPNSGGITAKLGTITLNLYNSAGTSIYSTSTTSSLDTTTHQFCFTLNSANFPNILNANYNVGVTATYNISGSLPCGGTTFDAATDPDANPGWDISFQNCSPTCNFDVSTTKLSLCDNNHDGVEIFNLQNANSSIVSSTAGFSFSYFTSFNDANSNTNSISSSTSYSSGSKTLYVRVAQSATCFKIIPITLEIKNPYVNISGILNVCSGSTVLTASSGSSYLWGNGATTQNITVTSIGTYSVTVTDSGGCSNTASVSIEPTQTATTPNVVVTQPNCFSTTGTIQITTSASQYSFDNGNTWTTNSTKNNLYPNTYQIKIKTINGCISYPLSVTISAALTSYPNYSSKNPAFCGDVGSITITTAASFYSFDNGATWVTNPIATNLSVGTYKIRTKDAQGCISNFNTVVLSSVTLVTPTYKLINPACGVSGSLTINEISDFYTFDGGSTWTTSNTLTNLTTKNYSIGIKNNLGCTSEYSYVYVNDLKDISPNVSIVQPICGTGGSIAITTAADFYSFDNGKTWTTNSISTNLPPDTYLVKIKNAAGCISGSYYVTLYTPYLDSPLYQVTQPQCGINGSITINTLSDFYSFDGGKSWVTNNTMSLPPGSYTILIKNNLGCISSSSYPNLYTPNLPEPPYTIVQPTCSNTGSITINTVEAFYSIDGGINWSTNPVFNNLSGDVYYYIKIKNNDGCVSYGKSVVLNINYLADPTYTFINPSCSNKGSITFTSTADLYSIDEGKTWSSNPVFSNLTSGYYYPLVKNNAGCVSYEDNLYLSSSVLNTPNFTIVYPCNNNKGSITFTTSASFYSIDNGKTWSSNPVFSNLASGSYYLLIKNNAGCMSDYYYTYIDSYFPNPNVTVTQPVCGTSGSITFNTSAASYSIDNGVTWVTTPVFSNLNSGTYYVKIKNSAGCTSSSQYIDLQQPYISTTPNFTVSQPTCGTGGIITITTPAAQYSKNGGSTWQTSPVFSNLASGSYNIVIKNSQGCISHGIYTQINPYYLPNPNITIVQPSCGSNGSITIATAASQYSFDGGNTWTSNPVLSNLTSGYYNISIKNNLGCTSNPYSMSVTIHSYYLPNPLVTSTQPSCGNSGNITVLTAADFYSFDNGTTWTTNPILLNPAPKTYYVKIKNNLGCVSQSQYLYINQYSLPSPSLTTTQPTCSIPSGTIKVNTAADQYSFDNGVTWVSNSTATNLTSGSYNIKTKNSLGCESSTAYAYIYSPPSIPNAPTVKVTQPSSCGTTDGSITVNTSALEYSFNNGTTWTTNSTKINLAAGTYYIKTRNSSSGCESMAAVVILNSGTTIAAPTFTVINPGCSNQNGTITISTPASYYSFDDGVTYVASNSKTNLPPGTYKVKIKNAAGCISNSGTATIISSANLPPPNYLVTQPDCSNATGSITITSAVNQYSFDNGVTFSSLNTQSGLVAGNYQIIIKDASGCVSIPSSITINSQPTPPNAPVISINHPLSCATSTGTISVTSNGSLFSFDNGVTWSSNSTSSPLISGTYQVVTKETNTGCASNAIEAIINAPPNIPAPPTILVTQPTTCANPFGTIQITNSALQCSFDNGITYSANTNSGNLIPGNYQIRVKNSNDCESTALPVTIIAPTDYPNNPNFTTIQPDCNNPKGSITITDSATEYSFDNGVTWIANATESNLNPNTYFIKVKNNNGCISDATTVVLTPFTNFPSIPTLTNTQLFCIQQNAIINNIVITGQNIKWYDAPTGGNLLPASTSLVNGQTYYASQTINSCESARTPVLTNIQNTPAPTGTATQTFCTSQNATLNDIVVNGNNLIWYVSNTSTTPISNTTLLANGTTYYAAQTINGCESIGRFAVTAALTNTLNATNYSETICDDLNNGKETIDLTSYNSNLISNTSNCTFEYYSSLSGATNQTTSELINSKTNYNLTIGLHTIYVRMTSDKGCFQIVELKLTLVSKPIIPIDDILPICEKNTITVNAGSGFDSYLWSNGSKAHSIVISKAGNYAVTVTKNHGNIVCSSTKKFSVVLSNIATITSIETQDWTDNENIITVNTSGLGNYEYSTDGIHYQDSNTFSGLLSGYYTVFVRDKNGCGITNDEVFLLTYPKFFTPNGDGYNDTWKIKFSQYEPGLNVKIIDRYGKLIKSLDNYTSWDGTFNGNPVISDDYWFIVTRADGKEYKGHFALKR